MSLPVDRGPVLNAHLECVHLGEREVAQSCLHAVVPKIVSLSDKGLWISARIR